MSSPHNVSALAMCPKPLATKETNAHDPGFVNDSLSLLPTTAVRWMAWLTSVACLTLGPLSAQEPDKNEASSESNPVDGDPDPAAESKVDDDPNAFVVPEQMQAFDGQVGRWKGIMKTAITEEGKKTLSNTRYEWTGGYLLGGHLFEIRGFGYGELGRTSYRWQYSFDRDKERYMAAYYDSHGRTSFFEGKQNKEETKVIWRLLAPPGDMTWEMETDLKTDDGIEINSKIKSADFNYDLLSTAVFKRL